MAMHSSLLTCVPLDINTCQNLIIKIYPLLPNNPMEKCDYFIWLFLITTDVRGFLTSFYILISGRSLIILSLEQLSLIHQD